MPEAAGTVPTSSKRPDLGVPDEPEREREPRPAGDASDEPATRSQQTTDRWKAAEAGAASTTGQTSQASKRRLAWRTAVNASPPLARKRRASFRSTTPPNKDLKLTKPGILRSFAA